MSETGISMQEGVLAVDQGDIVRNVEMIEYATEHEGILEVGSIVFPLAVVLSQTCDLLHDYGARQEVPTASAGKLMLSALVAPLYNADQVIEGTHLGRLDIAATAIQGKTRRLLVRNNEYPRYHYLEFPETVQIAPCVVDFKHYFTIAPQTLAQHRAEGFVCRLDVPHREHLAQRFVSWTGRVGLP